MQKLFIKKSTKQLIIGVVQDITKEKNEVERLKRNSEVDEISGLHNRYVYKEKISEKLKNVFQGNSGLLIHIFLKGYRKMEDLLGENSGNKFVIHFAAILKSLTTEDDIVARISDDEFVIFSLCYGNDILNIIHGLSSFNNSKATLDTGDYPIRFDIGYALYPDHAETTSELVEYAIFATSEIKENVSISVNEFSQKRHEAQMILHERISEFSNVLTGNQMYPVYQGIYEMKSENIFAFEALTRVDNPKYREIHELIQDAYILDRIGELSIIMLKNQIHDFSNRNENPESILFLNINREMLTNYSSQIEETILQSKIPFKNLVFEISEKDNIDDVKFLEEIDYFRGLGCRIALDDFGSEKSTDYFLLKLSPDIIKLDIKLIKNIHSDQKKKDWIRHFVNYCHMESVGIKVLAEGVETKEEFLELISVGIEYIQGYYIGAANKEIEIPQIKIPR